MAELSLLKPFPGADALLDYYAGIELPEAILEFEGATAASAVVPRRLGELSAMTFLIIFRKARCGQARSLLLGSEPVELIEQQSTRQRLRKREWTPFSGRRED